MIGTHVCGECGGEPHIVDEMQGQYWRKVCSVCGSTGPFVPRESFKPRTNEYREGFDDALRWMRDVFNLDTEDVDEINRVLEGGHCEGVKR